MDQIYHKETFEKISKEKQERIMHSAITEFSRNGFNGANINIIAENAEISIGSLYKYFSSKEDLFLAIFNRGYKLLEQVFSNVAIEKGNIFEIIENLLKAAQQYSKQYPQLTQMYLDLSTEGLSHLSKRLSKKMESISSGFYLKIISKAKQDGVIPDDVDEKVASFCLDNLLLMIQYSYTSKYFIERMRIFLGEEIAADDDRIVKGFMHFIRGGFHEIKK